MSVQTDVNLTTRVGPLELTNPLVAASGTFGYGDEFADRLELERMGALITKTVTCEPRPGNQPLRAFETASGMLNSIGLENVGIDNFLSTKIPRIRELPCPVIVSLGGEHLDELERMIVALEKVEGPAGYEINFSCPNVTAGGARFWADATRMESTVVRLRDLTRRSLWAKMSPNVTDPRVLARAAENGGADALTVCNTFVGSAIDARTRKFLLGSSTGGLSGPAIKPLALAQVYEVSGVSRIPIVGSGGATCARDVIEFILAGATAVQIGTAHFVNPAAGTDIANELITECRTLEIEKLSDLVRQVGSAR